MAYSLETSKKKSERSHMLIDEMNILQNEYQESPPNAEGRNVIPRREKGKMSPEDEHRIISNYTYLTENLSPLQPLLDSLTEIYVLNKDDLEVINTAKSGGRKAMIRKFLDILRTCGINAYSKFIDCLNKSGYGAVAETLVSEENFVSEPGLIQGIDSNKTTLHVNSSKTTLQVNSSKMNQLTEQDVHLRNKQLEDEVCALREKLEKFETLEKKIKSLEDVNLKVLGTDGEEADVQNDGAEECKVIQKIPLIEQKGLMISKDWSKIQTNIMFLMDELEPKDLIMPLYSKCVLNEEDVQELEAESNKRTRARNMLFKLRRCGPNAYKKFLKCLELEGYSQAIKQLEPHSIKYKGHIKYPGQTYIELIDYSNPLRKEFIDEVEDSIEGLYPESTELVVVKQLSKGCVQVTFSLISLDSNKSESQLRRILESAVKSGFIGRKKVSSEGFSFEKVEEGDEHISTEEQQDIQNQFRNLKHKLKIVEEENSNLRKRVRELEDECNKLKIRLEEVEHDDPKDETMVQTDQSDRIKTDIKNKVYTDIEEVAKPHISDTDDTYDHLLIDEESKGMTIPDTDEESKGMTIPDDVKYSQTSIQNNMATTITSTTPLLNQRFVTQDVITTNYNKTTDNNKMDWRSICETCRYGTLDDVNTLIHQNIDLNIPVNDYNQTPVFYCVLSDKQPVDKIQLLFSAGAMLHVKDRYGRSLLHWACCWGTIDCVKYLLEQGLDKNDRNDFNMTPVFHCVWSNKQPLDKIQLLFAAGAMLDVKSDEGSLLEYARLWGKKECESYLRELGLDK
ncbi:uncharacterized protein LOC126811624 isoform X1 [Patella vulgata]|uniref:uncharacterized protein LOC126811624 isoform X1 n=1 Tax=Patella vulgata TaxID=6465 RepID=UPI0024A7CA7F|nr:uncharacterized protein LOC126811624 isoform X1 [Patella vulgata]XP_055954513.1 uncharacterized protein LOC126811624 isoform X1 [Patella vulgata]